MNYMLLAAVANALSFSPIEDQSELPFLSHDLKDRKTAKIVLSNGLEMLLISDPMADQSAAVVSVQSGSWSDPLEFPGMAHFCEHMLFMGTAKYPDTNDFFAQISNFDGRTNAFTAPDKTVYMFSAQEKGFLSLLDRFAHFFIDPLFNPANISREMHAVDQEFALQKENDGWREYMVFKETGNQNHPNRLFSTGNSKTLSKIPQTALIQWHKNHYGANRMRAAIYSSLPLDTLKMAVQENFALIPKIASAANDFKGSLTSQEQKQSITFIDPIHHRQTLSLSWELPPNLSDDDSKSADLIAYALGRGQKYSLLQKLKNEQLIDNLSIQVNRLGGKKYSFFEIELELSKKGMENIDLATIRVFQALAGLKETGIPKFLFDEKNALAKLHYQYQKRIDAFDYISSIGRSIADEELATYPKKSLLGLEYNPQMIRDTLSFLTPNHCSIVRMSPKESAKVAYDRKEKWLDVPYTIRPLPLDWSTSWSGAKPHLDIRLAEPNPFIPAKLSLVKEERLDTIPTCIANTNLGIAYYIRSDEYQTPEGAIHLHILSPELSPSARSYVLGSLYLDHLTDQIHPLLGASASAGINTRFEIEKNHLHITLSGFSEKIPLLMKEILREMPQNPPTREQFDLYAARHEKDYVNSLKVLPVKQAKELLSSLINPSRTTKQENLAALKTISFEDFLAFHKNLFEKSYFEALFAGNFSIKTATSSWLDILNMLGKTPYPKSEHFQTKALHLPDDEGPFLIAKETHCQGNAAILLLDEGNFSLEKKSAQKILSAALQEPFFDTLRTKQKTGYIAQSMDAEFEKRLYQYFLVQSNTHQPEDLLHRFELFLEEFREDFATQISEERFATLKASAIETLKTQCRNIIDKASLWDMLAFEENGNFTLIEQRIQSLEDLSYEQFLSFADEFLSRSNRKRLAILYTGKIPSPFTYLPTTVAGLMDVSTYAPRPAEQEMNTR